MRLKRGLIAIACIVLLYVLGPKVAQSNFSPEIDTMSVKLSEVDSLVREKNKNPIIKPYNQSKIYWADSIGKKQLMYCCTFMDFLLVQWKVILFTVNLQKSIR